MDGAEKNPGPVEAGPPPLPAAPPMVRGTAPMYRPQSAWPTVIGVIGIILGACGALQGLFGLASVFFMSWLITIMPSAGGAAAGMQAMQDYWPLQAAAAIAALAVALMLIVGSAQLLKRQRHAARMLRVWAWSKCGLALATTGVQFVLQQVNLQAMSSAGGPQLSGGVMTFFAVFGTIFSLGWLMLYPIFILIWLSRPAIRHDIESW
jgi:hypothetical protein